jgi:hypothetical protein
VTNGVQHIRLDPERITGLASPHAQASLRSQDFASPLCDYQASPKRLAALRAREAL